MYHASLAHSLTRTVTGPVKNISSLVWLLLTILHSPLSNDYVRSFNPFWLRYVSRALLQARILALNASYFLKSGGHFVISIKVGLLFPDNQLCLRPALVLMWLFCDQANCIDSTVPAEAVFESEVKKMVQEQLKPMEQVTLEPFERDHACVVGGYRMPKKQKVAA